MLDVKLLEMARLVKVYRRLQTCKGCESVKTRSQARAIGVRLDAVLSEIRAEVTAAYDESVNGGGVSRIQMNVPQLYDLTDAAEEYRDMERLYFRDRTPLNQARVRTAGESLDKRYEVAEAAMRDIMKVII